MKSFLIVLTLVGQSHSANYELVQGGRVVGSVRITQKITERGGKVSEMKMTLGRDEQRVDVYERSEWNLEGLPKSKSLETVPSDRSKREMRTAVFTPDAAVFTLVKGQKTETKTVTSPRGGELRALPEFWFLRDEPEPNKPFTYWRFDLARQVWQTVETTYLGEKPIVVDLAKESLHLIQTRIGTSVVDSYVLTSGAPRLIEQHGGITIRPVR